MSLIKTNAITTVAGKPILNSTGSILQVASTQYTSTFTTTSTSYVDVFSVTITPTSNSSKIFIECNALVCADTWSGGPSYFALRRASTLLHYARYNNWAGSAGDTQGNTFCSGLSYLDSPATTAATTYNFSVASSGGYTVTVNKSVNGNVTASYSSITVFEISG
jgi:hypothetical protein